MGPKEPGTQDRYNGEIKFGLPSEEDEVIGGSSTAGSLGALKCNI